MNGKFWGDSGSQWQFPERLARIPDDEYKMAVRNNRWLVRSETRLPYRVIMPGGGSHQGACLPDWPSVS
jgi:hypothetical protein